MYVGDGTLDNSQYGEEEEVDAGSSVYVKFNRMLHGKKAQRGRKQETLTINFLKKYIHYAKHRVQPELSDEASENIATAYAELRNANSNAKGGGGTLPITARTLETIIRLSTAHAKLKLSRTVLKSDVEAALKVLNFAIYHKELTEMDEREQGREREMERKRQADRDANNNERVQRHRRNDRSGQGDEAATEGEATEAMEVDEPPADQSAINISPERVEAFDSIFGQHMRANRLDVISIADIVRVINEEAATSYSRAEIMFLLERLQTDNRLMITDDMNVRLM